MTETTKLGLFTYDVKNGLGLIGYNVDEHEHAHIIVCLLYTSDAADE
mgnify:CR=1 FL=1